MTVPLRPDETVLIGRWLDTPAGAVEDEVAKRIESLVENALVKVDADRSGWRILYRDPTDQRLWELTYPHSEMHGGGPPMLKQINPEEALRQYAGSASNNRWRGP